MIAKKIKNPKKSASKSTRIYMLTDYVLNPSSKNNGEKCAYYNVRGFFLASSKLGWQAEMLALSQIATRTDDSITHYVLSWKEGEQPTEVNIEEVIDILLFELGLQLHQAIYGLHIDTANVHLHIVINRVHPNTYKVIQPNNGFDILAIHRAIARIEHAQGWECQENSCYEVLESGELGRVHKDTGRTWKPEQNKCDKEHSTSFKSAERIAIQICAPILRDSNNWAQLHQQLFEHGMRLLRRKMGAIVMVGDIPIKASRLGIDCSFNKLTQRLGLFEAAYMERSDDYFKHKHVEKLDASKSEQGPFDRVRNLSECRLAIDSGEQITGVLSYPACDRRHRTEELRWKLECVEPIDPVDLPQVVEQWTEYTSLKKNHTENYHKLKLELQQLHKIELQQLLQTQKQLRLHELAGDGAGKRGRQKQVIGHLAARHLAQKIALQNRQRVERQQLRDQWPSPPASFPTWLRSSRAPELVQVWRHRLSQNVMRIIAVKAIQSIPLNINDSEFRISHKRSQRMRQGRRPVNDFPAIIDLGDMIEVKDWSVGERALHAIKAASSKWHSFYIIGSTKCRVWCAKIAAELGLNVANPELQTEIEKNRLGSAIKITGSLDQARAALRRLINNLRLISPLVEDDWAAVGMQIAKELHREGHTKNAIEHAFCEVFPIYFPSLADLVLIRAMLSHVLAEQLSEEECNNNQKKRHKYDVSNDSPLEPQ
ncbi:relaxase/mobilization nuclease domain-containing protein [Chitinibacter bivalviorum]|uniref:Relaxase/mobilization nuclease domain-containing protein n=1 Tax=Chitinibacter bivalviorum TaxID=2739434 RepID=A0A7H9BIK1_9NEIS|nr:relaxase/mobilization nuclease domain-containing protein [Chitinibacter bivalviorum]QLG88048.1 relaxase/mobilization nuclease domain-containing protein [Chitinibacter bivalviorum]